MRRELSIVGEVMHGHTESHSGDVGDQAPMTPPPQALTAHHGHSAPRRTRQQFAERVGELLRSGVRSVRSELRDTPPCVLHGLARGETATATESELWEIVHAARGNPLRHGVGSDVGISATAGKPADIDNRVDIRGAEQLAEAVPIECAVPYGDQHRLIFADHDDVRSNKRCGCDTVRYASGIGHERQRRAHRVRRS